MSSNINYSQNFLNDGSPYNDYSESDYSDLETNPQTTNTRPSEKHVDLKHIQNLARQYNLELTIGETHRALKTTKILPPLEKGSEIFIGKLPKETFELTLLPLAAQFGTVREFRLMLDANGYNRGYAFVTYEKRAEASKALKGLNNREIKNGKLLGVCRSVDNCRLFVGGIPKSKMKIEILEEMKKVTEGVVNVIVYPSAADKTKNRGFAFIEYQTHKQAAQARRKLMPGKIQLWNHQIAVDWAEPEIDIDDDIMAKVKILYIRNLMLHTQEDTLLMIFTNLTGVGTIERIRKIRDFAFVHFDTRENAEKAKSLANGVEVDGSHIEITWAKPVDREAYAKYNRQSMKATQEPQVFPATPLYIDASGQVQTLPNQPAFILNPVNFRNFQQVKLHQPFVNTAASQIKKGGRGAGGMRAIGTRTYLNTKEQPRQGLVENMRSLSVEDDKPNFSNAQSENAEESGTNIQNSNSQPLYYLQPNPYLLPQYLVQDGQHHENQQFYPANNGPPVQGVQLNQSMGSFMRPPQVQLAQIRQTMPNLCVGQPITQSGLDNLDISNKYEHQDF